MTDIVQFIESLGGLHDATVTEVLWLPIEKRLELGIKDLYWNFEGLPEYQGPTGGRFIFSKVSKFLSEIDLAASGLMIADWLFEYSTKPGYSCEILFNSSGRLLIACSQIECQKDK